jgi:hypothetical protein
MSEQRPAISYDEFLAVFPPQTTEQLTGRGPEIVAEYEEKSKHEAMLAHLKRDPTANPNHIRYYEQKIAIINAKLEDPNGEA